MNYDRHRQMFNVRKTTLSSYKGVVVLESRGCNGRASEPWQNSEIDLLKFVAREEAHEGQTHEKSEPPTMKVYPHHPQNKRCISHQFLGDDIVACWRYGMAG